MDKVTRMAKAIQRFEGWRPGSRSYRYNNPGNLRHWGKTPVHDGYAQFPSYEAGFQALRTLLLNAAHGRSRVYRPSMTFLQFFQRYAPGDDGNHPERYAAFVTAALGCDLDTPLSWLLLKADGSGGSGL